MDGYITVKEAANRWGVSKRSVQSMCLDGRIKGATKVANVWVIPVTAEYPCDGRVKSGEYKNWRNKCDKDSR